MNPTQTQTKERSYVLTLAELCEALEDGRLASQRTDDYYTVRQSDLRRLAQTREVIYLDAPRTMMDHFSVAG